MAIPVLRRNQEVDRNETERPGEHAVERSALSWPVSGRWSPLSELNELHEQLGRLLGAGFGNGDWTGGWWRPAADVEETADAYVVELEIPGVKQDDISVEFGAGELTVSGEVKERQRVGFLRTRNRPVGRFHYRVGLPADVQDDQVGASLSDGVLTVRVPKTEHARRRRIPVT